MTHSPFTHVSLPSFFVCLFFFFSSFPNDPHMSLFFAVFFFFVVPYYFTASKQIFFSPSIYCYFRFRSAFGSIAIQIVALFPFFEGKGKKKNSLAFFPHLSSLPFTSIILLFCFCF